MSYGLCLPRKNRPGAFERREGERGGQSAVRGNSKENPAIAPVPFGVKKYMGHPQERDRVEENERRRRNQPPFHLAIQEKHFLSRGRKGKKNRRGNWSKRDSTLKRKKLPLSYHQEPTVRLSVKGRGARGLFLV